MSGFVDFVVAAPEDAGAPAKENALEAGVSAFVADFDGLDNAPDFDFLPVRQSHHVINPHQGQLVADLESSDSSTHIRPVSFSAEVSARVSESRSSARPHVTTGGFGKLKLCLNMALLFDLPWRISSGGVGSRIIPRLRCFSVS